MKRIIKEILLLVMMLIIFNSSAHGAVSDDIYVRKDIFEARMDRLEMLIEKNIAQLRSEIQEMRMELHQDIQKVDSKVEVLNERTESLKTSVYWGLSVMGIIVTVLTLIVGFAIFAPSLSEFLKGLRKPSMTAEEVEKIFQRLIEANNAKFFAGK